MTEHAPASGFRMDRRTAIAATGAAATIATITACSGYGNPEPANAEPEGAQDKRQEGAELARTADIPVGGGLITGDTVITQPAAGSFQGFSSTCTHLGCKVSEIDAGRIKCACHNSSFNLDGTVAGGPAPRALDARAIRVDGDRIVAG